MATDGNGDGAFAHADVLAAGGAAPRKCQLPKVRKARSAGAACESTWRAARFLDKQACVAAPEVGDETSSRAEAFRGRLQ